jgi:MoaA/NifB/PqqE/SkfB family radical SAM enzyme
MDVRKKGLARGKEMPFEFVEKVYKESARHAPAIDLIGGEPLLYPRLPEVLCLAGRTKVLSILTTNGLLLEDNAEAIVESGLPILQVSLDGWEEDSQRLRGNVKRSFESIVKGIAAVRRAKGARTFPIVRILTAITRHNYAALDRIQQVVHSLGVKYWGVANYFFVTESKMRAHRAFVLEHGLDGPVAADAIAGDEYLSSSQVAALKLSLARIRVQNRSLRLRINYNWDLDLDRYYSRQEPSRRSRCELPYRRLDVHSDGAIAVCVSGKTLGRIGESSLSEVWRSASMGRYRRMYESHIPMPMCFRCCGMSNTIRFDLWLSETRSTTAGYSTTRFSDPKLSVHGVDGSSDSQRPDFGGGNLSL